MSGRRRLGATEVRRLLAENDIVPSKSLGQNFVSDPNTVERIARLARVGTGDRVLEIGAGLGSLTLALLETGADLTVVEIDHRLVAILEELLPSSVHIVEADAMRADWDLIIGEFLDAEPGGKEGVVLVANLPYNVATPIVLKVLEAEPRIERMLVMVQREVGERLAADPGGRDYGQVSVRLRYFATAKVVGRVPPEVFFPRPHVESVLVEITRRAVPAVDPNAATYDDLVVLVRAGFGGRRKMLRKSLQGLIDAAVFERAGIAPTARAEELDITDWGRLAECR